MACAQAVPSIGIGGQKRDLEALRKQLHDAQTDRDDLVAWGMGVKATLGIAAFDALANASAAAAASVNNGGDGNA